jgi:hypothetical protein
MGPQEKLMSGPAPKKGARGSSREVSTKRSNGNGKRPSKNRKVLLIIVLALALCAVVLVATLANGSSRGLDIKKDDSIQYVLESSSSNTSGSLRIVVTNATSSSFEITYEITLNNQTTRKVVPFTGASGDWRSNIGNVMDKLSGSSSSATVSNETQVETLGGTKDATGYVITTTTQSGLGLYYEYWLGSTNKSPLKLVLTYSDYTNIIGNLIYTNIAEFQS